MSLYHVGDDGVPRVCVARPGHCTISDNSEHYPDVESARDAYEAKNRKNLFDGVPFSERAFITLNILKFSRNPEDRARAASNPMISPEDLNYLSDDPDPEVRWEVAHSGKTDPAKLLILSKDSSLSVVVGAKDNGNYLAMNKKKWKDNEMWLDSATSNKSNLVRLSAAQNMFNSQENLEKLSKDNMHHIRQAVALNPATDRPILDSMVDDEEPKVRKAVARSNNLSLHAIDRLGRDQDYEVRASLASNPVVELEQNTLLKLIKDPRDKVRISLLNNRNLNREYLKILEDQSDNSDVLKKLIKNHPNYNN